MAEVSALDKNFPESFRLSIGGQIFGIDKWLYLELAIIFHENEDTANGIHIHCRGQCDLPPAVAATGIESCDFRNIFLVGDDVAFAKSPYLFQKQNGIGSMQEDVSVGAKGDPVEGQGSRRSCYGFPLLSGGGIGDLAVHRMPGSRQHLPNGHGDLVDAGPVHLLRANRVDHRANDVTRREGQVDEVF